MARIRDAHRPSAAPASPQCEVDRQNRDLFKNQKVRDVVICGECGKPRCIYSNKKLTTDQVRDIVFVKLSYFQNMVNQFH